MLPKFEQSHGKLSSCIITHLARSRDLHSCLVKQTKPTGRLPFSATKYGPILRIKYGVFLCAHKLIRWSVP